MPAEWLHREVSLRKLSSSQRCSDTGQIKCTLQASLLSSVGRSPVLRCPRLSFRRSSGDAISNVQAQGIRAENLDEVCRQRLASLREESEELQAKSKNLERRIRFVRQQSEKLKIGGDPSAISTPPPLSELGCLSSCAPASRASWRHLSEVVVHPGGAAASEHMVDDQEEGQVLSYEVDPVQEDKVDKGMDCAAMHSLSFQSLKLSDPDPTGDENSDDFLDSPTPATALKRSGSTTSTVTPVE